MTQCHFFLSFLFLCDRRASGEDVIGWLNAISFFVFISLSQKSDTSLHRQYARMDNSFSFVGNCPTLLLIWEDFSYQEKMVDCRLDHMIRV